jgi:glycogen synthase
MREKKKLRVAMPAWEIGRPQSGLGVKIGGLGVIVEELPPELVKAAAERDMDLEVETLSPCFAHYDKSRLTRLEIRLPVTLAGHTFDFEVYQQTLPDGQKLTYFWDEWQLSWTSSKAIYPEDPQMALHLYAAVSQAMSGYIMQRRFDTVHLHDYHVGLIPFYLDREVLEHVPVHFTIHNATYQGVIPALGGGPAALERIHLPGKRLFHLYFEFFGHLNLMKACMHKVHESGGKITTVSGDIAGTWGYAAELRRSRDEILYRTFMEKGSPPGDVTVPNRGLDLFEKLPIVGITNGMADRNRAENLPELRAATLRNIEERQGRLVFKNPTTRSEMLAVDHNFDIHRLETKVILKRLLHLETFDTEPLGDPILLTAVGRLVDQKNLGLVAHIVERTLGYDPGAKFIILASASDAGGKVDEESFFHLAAMYPERVFFDNTFNLPLSKLIFAGGDFSLLPSRFEPCGLVDYEASLLGNIVIGRATGGLTKVRHCAYLYEWLDTSDREGEANAFFEKIKEAIDTYRSNLDGHVELIHRGMEIDASWRTSASQYVDLYQYGFMMKEWQRRRRQLIAEFISEMAEEGALFSRFFAPGHGEYSDVFDWQLRKALSQRASSPRPPETTSESDPRIRA